ncbi:winged helix-turn-helix transcriptional regulator [soil metagenome]
MNDESTGYGQYCPITRAVEVLGERWSFLIVRDLILGATRFNDLARGNPGLSRSLLSKRLRQFERAGIIDHVRDEYLLTPAGKDLEGLIMGLGEWGARWQFDDPRENELDPELLMWWVQDRLDLSILPDRRLVLEFDFVDQRKRFWIVRDSSGPSVCNSEPAFEIDVCVRTDLTTMYQVWLGKSDLRESLRDGTIEFIGSPAFVRRMPDVLQLSIIAPFVTALDAEQARRSAAASATSIADSAAVALESAGAPPRQ